MSGIPGRALDGTLQRRHSAVEGRSGVGRSNVRMLGGGAGISTSDAKSIGGEEEGTPRDILCIHRNIGVALVDVEDAK